MVQDFAETRSNMPASPPPPSDGSSASYSVVTLEGRTPSDVARDIVKCPAHWISPRSRLSPAEVKEGCICTCEHHRKNRNIDFLDDSPPRENEAFSSGLQSRDEVIAFSTAHADKYPWMEGLRYEDFREKLNEQRKRDYNQFLKVAWAMPAVHNQALNNACCVTAELLLVDAYHSS